VAASGISLASYITGKEQGNMKIKDEQTTLAVLAIILASVALWAIGCGGGSGGSYSGLSPTTPSTTTAAATPAAATPAAASTPAGAVTVNVVSTSGSGAFSPNPVQASSGATIVFKNATSEAHHLVMNDGTLIGDLAAGGSLSMPLAGSGGSYHCTIHPTMVGSINGASAPAAPTPDPSGSGYDY
jgi:plastocyanin